jgi:hypothetical protein
MLGWWGSGANLVNQVFTAPLLMYKMEERFTGIQLGFNGEAGLFFFYPFDSQGAILSENMLYGALPNAALSIAQALPLS